MDLEHPDYNAWSTINMDTPATNELIIVGIGISPNSMPALQHFLTQLSAENGMAFIVVAQLSLEYEEKLHRLLKGATAMPVVPLTTVTPIVANQVYISLQNHQFTTNNGDLRRDAMHHNQPIVIDECFRALAEQYGKQAVGVLLAGTNADGIQGLKRIKELGGVVFVQDPQEAADDITLRNAIATGVVDYVVTVDKLPAQLYSHYHSESQIQLSFLEATPSVNDATQTTLQDIFMLLRMRTGHDFTNYKQATILRQIQRRLQVHGFTNLHSYLSLLNEQASEVTALVRNFLISVTNFFRDPQAFETVEQALPQLFTNAMPGNQIRVWVAGCATGEEAYSVAILLRECAERFTHPPEIHIFATDIDVEAITSAREGVYPTSIEADISPERLARFFTREQNSYRVKREIRDLILFAEHNLLHDPPFSKLHLITCRNVLIYLERDIHDQIMQLFHFALQPYGLLMLGVSELTDSRPDLFIAINKQQRLFSTRAIARTTPTLLMPPQNNPLNKKSFRLPLESSNTHDILSMSALHLKLLELYAPPSVIVNEAYDIVHLSEHASRFLQFSGGEPSFNLLRIIHPDLRLELRATLFRALQNNRSETQYAAIHADNQVHLVKLSVQPVQIANAAHGLLLVIFDEVTEPVDPTLLAQVEPIAQHLDEELQRTRDNLRSTIEHYETSIEELRASNEELQAINEELRATTEELETSKEELQSINEELRTLNQDLKHTIDEINHTNSDLQNSLIATDIGILFLDHTLRLLSYTPRAEQLFNLLPSDVSRPFAHITHQLNYPHLLDDTLQVRNRLAMIARVIQAQDGRWYIARLLPYQSTYNSLAGVVLTFTDATDLKWTTNISLTTHHPTERMPENMSDAYIQVDSAWHCIYMNSAAEQLLHIERNQVLGQDIRRVYAYSEIAPYFAQIENVMQQRVETVFEANYVISQQIIEVRVFPNQDGGVTIHQRDMTKRQEDAANRWFTEQQLRQELAAANTALQQEMNERIQAQSARTEVMRRLVSAEENERRRISRELHDQMGQQLIALLLSLQSMKRLAEKQPDLISVIEQSQHLANTIGEEIHKLALQLRPTALDDLGLSAALSNYITNWSEHTHIKSEFHHLGVEYPRLIPDIETAIYRVVIEALTNIAKHAQASHVSIILDRRGQYVVAIVEDNGRGFETDQVIPILQQHHRLGLLGMQERATQLNGTLTVESILAGGTTIILRIPLTHNVKGVNNADRAEVTDHPG